MIESQIPLVMQYNSKESIKHHGGIAVYFNAITNYVDSECPEMQNAIQLGNTQRNSMLGEILELFYRIAIKVIKKQDQLFHSEFETTLHRLKARVIFNSLKKSEKNPNFLIYHHMNNFVLPNFTLYLLARKFRIVMLTTIVDFLDVDHPEMLTPSVVRQRKITRELLFGASELLIPIANFIQNDCITLGVSKEKLKVIKWGSDHINDSNPKNEVEYKENLSKLVFVLPAKSWPHKGHLKFLEEFLKSPKRSYKLVFIGDTDEIVEEINRLLTKYPDKADSFSNLGFLSDLERSQLFLESTGIILPSIYEGFGFPYFEATRMTKPIFCFSTKSYLEYFDNCNNPGVANLFDYETLNHKVENFENEYFEESLICMKNAIKDLRWDYSCELLFDTYRELSKKIMGNLI